MTEEMPGSAGHWWVEEEVLANELVRLEPMSADHSSALVEAAADGELSSLWYTKVPRPEGVAEEIANRLARRAARDWSPYTIFEQSNGRALGMSGYLNIPAIARRIEIGGTWLRASAHRTGMNAATKLLLLDHAFDGLGCMAVEFRTHRFNAQSRRALEGIGAQLDGILRQHFDPFGRPRDTCVYSIVRSEWPMVREHLEWRLSAVAAC